MAIQYGDILLENDEFLTSGGDIAIGDGISQQVGAIIRASPGNFRRHPTLGASLELDVNGPSNSREIAGKIQNALFLDGWRLNEVNINSDLETLEITTVSAVKTTDNTTSLV